MATLNVLVELTTKYEQNNPMFANQVPSSHLPGVSFIDYLSVNRTVKRLELETV